MKCSLESLIFLKRSLVLPILLLSSIPLHWSLRKAFWSLFAIVWNSAFKWGYLSFTPLLFLPIFSQLFVRPPQTAILIFCISFSWGWSWFLSPVQRQLYIGDNCTVPCTWQLRQFKMVCQTQEWAILFLSKATILGEKTDIKLRTSEKFNVCVCV